MKQRKGGHFEPDESEALQILHEENGIAAAKVREAMGAKL